MATSKREAEWYDQQAKTARQFAADAAGKGLEGMSSFHERMARAYQAEADDIRKRKGARLTYSPADELREHVAAADRALEAERGPDGEPDESNLRDLLADLMHWSDLNGFDFDKELATARTHHAAERKGSL